MPLRLKDVKHLPHKRQKLTAVEKVRKARQNYYIWRKKQDENHAFNRDQRLAEELR